MTGSHKLVMGSAIAPPDSLTVDPHLDAATYGGNVNVIVIPLLADSPAINRGSNTDGLTNDQRGAGFARIFGPAADIGAFEVQPVNGDTIFVNGFDSG